MIVSITNPSFLKVPIIFNIQTRLVAECNYVTSFSSISYQSNSEYWSQKQAQSGNIHSIILGKDRFQVEALTLIQIILNKLLNLTMALHAY